MQSVPLVSTPCSFIMSTKLTQETLEFGDILAKYYLQHATLISLQSIPAKATMRNVLEAVSACGELTSYTFRAGEKTVRAVLVPTASLVLTIV